MTGGRVAFLDGLRGVAILWVATWHYTNSLYADYFPYGDLYASIPVLAHGWVGVNLFFLISGFVILMTLERCDGFGEFLARRWSRLFPAMLLASIAILALSQLLGDKMPRGRADLIDLLPGLTFSIPTFWTWLLGRPVDELDGVFWTLYVEMGFYLLYGLLFFRLGWRRGLMAFALVWIATIVSSRLAKAAGLAWLAQAVTPLQWIGAEYHGWFVAGALFFKAAESGSSRLFGAAALLGIASALTSDLWQPGDAVSKAWLVACVILFAAAMRSRQLQVLLEDRRLMFAGAVSYPLYLLHNEIGVGLINTARIWMPAPLWPLLPVLMLAMMLLAAWLIARFVEPPLTRKLRDLLLPASVRLQD